MLLSLILLLFSAESARADAFETAFEDYLAGRFDKACPVFAQVAKGGGSDGQLASQYLGEALNKSVELALKDLEGGAPARALTRLKLVQTYEPGPDVELWIGLATAQLGRYAEAREIFGRLIERPEFAEELKTKARGALEALEKGVRRVVFSLGLEFSAGFNTNYRSSGDDAPLEGASFYQASLAADVCLYCTELRSVRVGPALSWEEIPRIRSERFLAYGMEASFRKSFGRNGVEAEFGPAYRQQRLGGSVYLNRVETLGQLSWQALGGRLSTAVFGFHNDPEQPSFEYLRGNSWNVSLAYDRSWRWAAGQLRLGYEDLSTGDLSAPGVLLPIAYRDGFSTLTLQTPPSVRGWSVRVSSGYHWRVFKRPSYPHDVKRVDREIDLALRVEKGLPGQVKFFVAGSSLLNASSLGFNTADNRNFDQHRLLAGISWDWSS